MKAFIIMGGLAVGIIVGLLPGINKPTPLWWRFFIVTLIVATIFLNLMPPLAGTLEEVKFLTGKVEYKSLPVLVKYYKTGNDIPADSTGMVRVPVSNASMEKPSAEMIIPADAVDKSIQTSDQVLINLRYLQDKQVFEHVSTAAVNPSLVLPYIGGLKDRIRIMNFHVPVAWVTVLAYLVSMIYAIMYLRKRDLDYDTKAVAAAMLGTMFCVLATVTGMIWAKFNWGSFWNWDPREVSIFILLLIYFAYFSLRAAIDNETAKARLSAVYSIIAFITVPFLVFILPRLQDSLHPGSKSEGNIGPVLSSGAEMLNPVMQVNFGIALAGFTLLFFWLLNLTYRYKKLNNDIVKFN